MIELLQRFVAWLMNRVRVNQIQQFVQGGRLVFLKRRRLGGSVVVWIANRFLAYSQSGIRMFVRADEWVNWEVHCARLLYPDRPVAQVGPRDSIILPNVPGVCLRELLRQDDADLRPFVAAARELRRVHRIHCDCYQAAWSHGDLHLDNILYDQATDQANLIDFDTRHEFQVSQTWRHGDDLKTLLLELMTLPDDRWRPFANAVLEEYGDAVVLNELSRQRCVPQGIAKILWFTRTNCVPIREIEPRFQRLRAIIAQVASDSNIASVSPTR